MIRGEHEFRMPADRVKLKELEDILSQKDGEMQQQQAEMEALRLQSEQLLKEKQELAVELQAKDLEIERMRQRQQSDSQELIEAKQQIEAKDNLLND